MPTTEEVLVRLERTKKYLEDSDRASFGHWSNVCEAIDKIQKLTPKHDPEIKKLAERLRAFVERDARHFSEEAEQIVTEAADRLEAMNPPAPPKTFQELRTDAYDWLFRAQAETPENRAKLEAAIKILGEK